MTQHDTAKGLEKESIFLKVKELLIDVLGLDEAQEDEITLESDIIDDLAAESIDFIDICFRLEKDFKLGKVNPGDIFPNYFDDRTLFDDSLRVKEEKLGEIISNVERDYPHMKGEILSILIKNEPRAPKVILQVKNLVYFVSHRLNDNFQGNRLN